MNTRILGNSGVALTTVGLGTWAIGGGDWRFGWGPQDDQAAVDTVMCAVDLGINWVDTAAVYGEGHSEELVGRALKQLGPARRPFVATKCSRVIQPDGSIAGVLKRESILQEVESSLRRLGVDTIDLYQLHWPLPDEDIEEGWQTLVDLKQQGKVRLIGVSNFNADQMRRLLPAAPITSLQPPYSMVVRDIEQDTLGFCREHGIGVIAYSPMYKGLLTGKFTRERLRNLDPSDHRHSLDPRFQPPQIDVHLQLVDALRPIADRNNCTLAQLAIAWTLRHPAVTAAIVGARHPEQIEMTVKASELQLDEQAWTEVESCLEQHTTELQQVTAR